MLMQELVHNLEYSENQAIYKDDLEEAIDHGILVSKLAHLLSKELKMSEDFCYSMAMAGLVHDIGKLKLGQHLYGRSKNTMIVEEMKYIRLHSSIGYEILKKYGYDDFISESILHHHENYDGTGYPGNIKGNDIPIGGRILRICDVYAALVSDRRYRVAFEKDIAVKLMIEEVKNFDMEIFLAFLGTIYTNEFSEIDLFVDDINQKEFAWRNILHDGYY